jgi:hypothetical protein
MAVGNIESEDKGTAARYNDNKIEYELIPTHLLESTARVFMHGKKKYKAWNWAKGMPWSVVIGCMKRHLAAIERGEDFDVGKKGSGLRHIGHIMCNAIMLEHYMNTFPEGDDRPKWFNGKAEGSLGQNVPLESEDEPSVLGGALAEHPAPMPEEVQNPKILRLDIGTMTEQEATKAIAKIQGELDDRLLNKLLVSTSIKPTFPCNSGIPGNYEHPTVSGGDLT